MLIITTVAYNNRVQYLVKLQQTSSSVELSIYINNMHANSALLIYVNMQRNNGCK